MEICIDCVESAINAEIAGASRVELCGNLMEGGTTPSLGLFEIIKERTKIPVFVMIRPRGGDFLFSDLEYDVMKRDIKLFKSRGADGFVFGLLTVDGDVDKRRNKELLDMCKPCPVTFHRAFDVVCDGAKALEDIIELGFDRVLTSGLEPTALEGLPNLTDLVQQAGNRIIVVPGAGINEKNLERILKGSNAREFHCSARVSQQSRMNFTRSDIHMGGALYSSEYSLKVSGKDRMGALKILSENR